MSMVVYAWYIFLQFTRYRKAGNYRGRYHKYLKTKYWRFNRQLVGNYRCATLKGLGGWYCEDCGATDRVLQVHHTPEAYEKAIFIEFWPFYWKYFRVLCRSCHYKIGFRGGRYG